MPAQNVCYADLLSEAFCECCEHCTCRDPYCPGCDCSCEPFVACACDEPCPCDGCRKAATPTPTNTSEEN